MRCRVPGEDHPEAPQGVKPPGLGGSKSGIVLENAAGKMEPQCFTRCPLGRLYADREAMGFLEAYYDWKEFGRWPERRKGGEDPRVRVAFRILERETQAIDKEELDAMAKRKP